jgi:hypothetical protein
MVPRGCERRLAGGREARRAARAHEQWRAERVFERADVAAHRGLRDTQPPRGAAEVQLLGDRDERAQVARLRIHAEIESNENAGDWDSARSRRHRRCMDTDETTVWARTLRMLRPYRWTLAGLATLVVLEALASIASPLLLREIVDRALPERDTMLLSVLALGMVASAGVRSGLDVRATRVSSTLGQAVAHDLRGALFAHVQRTSLAFFTRTRSGEIQTRIAGDVGAIDNVVTNSAGSLVQNVTTVVAVLAALFVLGWPLALFSCAAVPVLAWLNRRTGRAQRRIGRRRQERSGDLASLVNESLSVSGVVLARTTNRGADLLERFRAQSRAISDLEIEAGQSGRWRRSTVTIAFTAMPAAIYWLGGMTAAHGGEPVSIGTLVAFTSMQNRLVSPVGQLLGTWQSLQGAGAIFARIFEVLDMPVDVAEAPSPRELAGRGGGVRFEDVWFATTPHPRHDHGAARRLRHRRRGARDALLGWGASAPVDRQDPAARPADPRPRRGHERARRLDGAARAGRDRRAVRRPHHDHDRPPPVDDPSRRADRRARRRPDRRAGHARRAARVRRALCGAAARRRRAGAADRTPTMSSRARGGPTGNHSMPDQGDRSWARSS